MINITPTHHQKKFAKRYAKKLALLTVLPFIAVNLFASLMQEPSLMVIADNSFTQCKFDQALQHAKRLGLKVENTDRFGWYNFVGTQQAVAEFQQGFFNREKKYLDELSNDEHKICEVHNLRQLMRDTNPKLMPYIPVNADYVSYHPTQDKAVYCHYQYAQHAKTGDVGSHCEFVTIEDKKIVYYDISDMERRNLEWWVDNRYNPLYSFQVNSYVAKWEETPTTYFGFKFMTVVNLANYGIGYDY